MPCQQRAGFVRVRHVCRCSAGARACVRCVRMCMHNNTARMAQEHSHADRRGHQDPRGHAQAGHGQRHRRCEDFRAHGGQEGGCPPPCAAPPLVLVLCLCLAHSCVWPTAPPPPGRRWSSLACPAPSRPRAARTTRPGAAAKGARPHVCHESSIGAAWDGCLGTWCPRGCKQQGVGSALGEPSCMCALTRRACALLMRGAWLHFMRGACHASTHSFITSAADLAAKGVDTVSAAGSVGWLAG